METNHNDFYFIDLPIHPPHFSVFFHFQVKTHVIFNSIHISNDSLFKLYLIDRKLQLIIIIIYLLK